MTKKTDSNYVEWQDNFTTIAKPYSKYNNDNDNTTSICISALNTKFADISEYNRIGLDLPTWININDKKPTIMFVAQDPLRSEYYDTCHDIIVSSPFGVQDKEHRNSRHGEVYFSIFSELVENGYGVYLTDTNKFFLKSENSTNFTKNNIQNYDEILRQEIEIVNPEIIVAFGKQAQHSVSKIDGDKRILYLIHPSGAARGHIKKEYDTFDCSNKKIAEIYISKVLSLLTK